MSPLNGEHKRTEPLLNLNGNTKNTNEKTPKN